MKINVTHQTRYSYDAPVNYSIQRLRLTPRAFDGQQINNWSVQMPGIDQALAYTDGLGNPVQVSTILDEHRDVLIDVSGEVETSDTNGVVQGLDNEPPVSVFMRPTDLTKADAAIIELANSIATGSGQLDRAHALLNTIRERVKYEVGTTDSDTTAAEALQQGQGVCQDHSHIFISACRVLDMPARYVTGYLVIDDNSEGEITTAEAHHAWAEAWIDGMGWIAFDVANGICADQRYVRLASGLDFISAAPLRGSRRGHAGEELEVQVSAQQQ